MAAFARPPRHRALTVKLAVDGQPDTFLLIWTTTPWTLPSNLGVAVGEDLDYVRARHEDGHTYVVARDLLKATLGDKAEVLATLKGRELLGWTYQPLFPFFADRKAQGAFRVIASGHVTTTDGTGLVHMAPAFGEDDFEACKKAGIALVDPVDDEGKFTAAVPPYAGQNVKDADKQIIHDLKAQHAVFKHATVHHAYPYCYRSGTPLIYKATPSWYVRVEPLRDAMVKNNAQIHWRIGNSPGANAARRRRASWAERPGEKSRLGRRNCAGPERSPQRTPHVPRRAHPEGGSAAHQLSGS